MGDSAETFRAMTAYHKERRQNCADANIIEMKKLGIPAIEQDKNVYRINGRFGAVMYYPTSSKWQHKGRVYRGTPVEFKEWLKRGHWL